jgi:hypothetical protein
VPDSPAGDEVAVNDVAVASAGVNVTEAEFPTTVAVPIVGAPGTAAAAGAAPATIPTAITAPVAKMPPI